MVAPRRYFPSIAALRALEALDRLGSASEAAADLDLTQSAVSRQLQALEQQLGVTLVERSHKQLALTEAAQEYAAEIRRALTRIAQATHRVQEMPVGGTLNLAILPAFGMRWLMPKLPDFARLNPDITINMTTRLQRVDFSRDTVDAALQYGRKEDWPETEQLMLKHEQLLPVCAPGFLEGRQIETPKDLLSCSLLHIQTRPQAWRDWFRANGVDAQTASSGAQYDQFATITQAAQHGLGVALMPDYLVEQDLAQGRLVALFDQPMQTDSAYYLVWPEARAKDKDLKLFREWLAPQAQAEDPLPR
ncbi:LysR family transcriptional regulator [Epibacterium sp. SM1969]|uniref:LysR family transcriptional regulator n=1 Tax=Tritonibacter aquimaris TaxID=2663379 RepID=A0A844AU53_9RHOB|nr:LysR family transcriptional regulator [Tritonibacter aquimaris]MQY41462.1 LysR family transcriptional regulator [Tritonibacter aquimaris]